MQHAAGARCPAITRGGATCCSGRVASSCHQPPLLTVPSAWSRLSIFNARIGSLRGSPRTAALAKEENTGPMITGRMDARDDVGLFESSEGLVGKGTPEMWSAAEAAAEVAATLEDDREALVEVEGGDEPRTAGVVDEGLEGGTYEERKAKIQAASRERTQAFLDDPIVQVIDGALTLLLCACLAVNTLPDLTPFEKQASWAIENGVALLFAYELMARWWVEELKPSYWWSPYTIVDALSLLPLVLGAEYSAAAVLRVLRILRLSRLLRKDDFNRIVARVTGRKGERDIPEYFLRLAQVLFTIFCIIFINAGLIYQAEHSGNPQFGDFFDALYFSVTTLTTVGFGDIAPITSAGRATVSFSILTGVVLVPAELSALARALLLLDNNRAGTACRQCGLSEHSSDAAFCCRCGTALFANSAAPGSGPTGPKGAGGGWGGGGGVQVQNNVNTVTARAARFLRGRAPRGEAGKAGGAGATKREEGGGDS